MGGETDLHVAHRVVGLAGSIARDAFGSTVAHEVKADGTPVSDVDRRVERAVLDALAIARPGDAVLAEESGLHAGDGSGRRWIVDPLDMTSAYLAGDPGWGVHLALEVDGRIELGIITRPARRLRWWAVRGEGAFRSTDGAPMDRSARLSVSGTTGLAGARVGGFAAPGSPSRAALAGAARWVDERECIVGAFAEGRLDAFVDDGGRPWDQAPAALIAEEAGGSFFDPDGGHRVDRGWVTYTNGHLDRALRALLSVPDA